MAEVPKILTAEQKLLIVDLYDTKTPNTKVGRRGRNAEGYFLYPAYRPSGAVDFPVNDEEFALKLHERDIEAELSPFYLNYRNLPDEMVERMAREMVGLFDGVDAYAGIPDAGTPFGRTVARLAEKPHLDIFSKTGQLGGRQIVPNPDAPRGDGIRLVIVDDMITQADTKNEAGDAAQELGYEVVGFSVFTDREQGGPEQMAKRGRVLRAAFGFLTDMVPTYREAGRIEASLTDNIAKYIAKNQAS